MNKNNTNPELTLEEKLIEARKARAISLEQAITTRKLENELTYVNSDRYLTDEMTAVDNTILAGITTPLDNISDKHFTHYAEFNFGFTANALIGAIRSVMLQKKLGFVALDEACLLNPALDNFRALIESDAQAFPDAIGRNTYFDKLSGVISHGVVGDAVETRAILERLARKLGLVVPDFSQITQAKFAFIEEKSVIRAEQAVEDNKLLDPSNEELASSSDDATTPTFKSA